MKVLVIEDDDVQRLLLQRLLTKKFQADVVLAKDGLEGLVMIQEESPDLVLLDVMMPVMDGTEVLEAIRTDAKLSSLPVVIISCVDHRQMVLKMLSLGVLDYIKKPAQPEYLLRRLADVMSKVRAERPVRPREQTADPAGIDGKPKLLIVDGDPNFTSIVSEILGHAYTVLERGTGAAGLQCYLSENPSLVCVGRGVPLMNEHMLARKIRTMDEKHETGIYLCAEDEKEGEDDRGLFDGVIKRSFVPDVFLEEFNSVVLGRNNLRKVLSTLIGGEIGKELISAAQQVLGVMAGLEVGVQQERRGQGLGSEIVAAAELMSEPDHVKLVVGFGASEKDFQVAAGKILCSPLPVTEGAEDAFVEIVNTIGGRIRTSLDRRGIRADISRSWVSRDPGELPSSWEFAVPVKAETGEEYTVGITIGN